MSKVFEICQKWRIGILYNADNACAELWINSNLLFFFSQTANLMVGQGKCILHRIWLNKVVMIENRKNPCRSGWRPVLLQRRQGRWQCRFCCRRWSRVASLGNGPLSGDRSVSQARAASDSIGQEFDHRQNPRRYSSFFPTSAYNDDSAQKLQHNV